ncbi:MAG: Ig-like domain-containing protein [Candidatus Bathyarchaeales archaeon]
MKLKLLITLITVTALSAVSSLPQPCLSNGYTLSYNLLESPIGSKQYKLNIVVPESLYEYYNGKDHKQVSVRDFAKFVTPYALQPVADRLREIYSDHEDFANGVLMIVHQIPYSVTLPAKYPIETMVENCGDCDLFSYIAASIMKAGGLDVVLLYYEEQTHMNIGVNLPHAPRYARTPVFFVTYNDIRYYVAECTGDDWKNGWRVGECPQNLMQETPRIITLENCEEWAPGQVSASYETLLQSTISLVASSIFVIQGSTITLSGQLSPKLQNKPVTIYVREGGSPWGILGITETDSSGKFSYVWSVNGTGICQLRASWSGDEKYAGADSPVIGITVLSSFFILLSTVTAVLVCAGVLVFLMSAQRHYDVEEPKLPKIPP